jgi:hypothetical protein
VTPGSPDIVAAAERLLAAARESAARARAIGGVGVLLSSPSARRPPLARDYKDLDIAVPREDREALARVLAGAGYRPDEEFNALHGAHQMFFSDPVAGIDVDVIVDRLEMCHELDLRGAFDGPGPALAPADLLLGKLQIVELTDKDLKDAVALLLDHDIGDEGIDPARVNGVLSRDWGWWRTSTRSLERIRDFAAGLAGLDGAGTVAERIGRLEETIEQAPKSRGWKIRARVGERVRWYATPEEPER